MKTHRVAGLSRRQALFAGATMPLSRRDFLKLMGFGLGAA